MSGWISLHRKIRTNPVFADLQLLRLWIICLTEASHKEHKMLVGKQTVTLQPGQFVTGRFDLHKMYNDDLKPKDRVTEYTVWRWLQTLAELDFLQLNSSNKYTVVTIVKWREHQHFEQQDEQENDQQMSSKRAANEQQMSSRASTNNNYNNNNNGNKGNKKDNTAFEAYTSNPTLIESLESFIEFRKKIKKPMTDKAITLLLGKLDKFANNDEDKIAILEQSILNGWQGVFELKTKKGGAGNGIDGPDPKDPYAGVNFGF